MKPTEICRDEQRRIDARRKPLNGIDYIEVERSPGPGAIPTLAVYFFGKAPDELASSHIAIEGGTRITGVQATDVQICPGADREQEGFARVTVNKDGDFSTCTLRITGLAGFDPIYSSFEFTFKPDCPADLDCQDEKQCPPERGEEPDINYLVKDYQGFRQLILDRWALIMPEWKERHIPDLGIALAEIFAYTGDYLSYYQDAVATEAYIGTARQRISVRRHARLVDYAVHEGCNARALLCVETDSDTPELDPGDFYFITNSAAVEGNPAVVPQSTLESLPQPAEYEVFEPVSADPIRFYRGRNRISFYTWGDHQCCLPAGSTSATLRDEWDKEQPPDPAQHPEKAPAYHEAPREEWGYRKPPQGQQPPASPVRARKLDSVKSGDLLVFMEVPGTSTDAAHSSEKHRRPKLTVASEETSNPPAVQQPNVAKLRDQKTGNITDQDLNGDPLRRHAVRITRIERATDELYEQPVVNIWWDAADALPMHLCLSSLGRAPECELIEEMCVACGNVILVDHGRRIDGDPLDGCVPVVEMAEQCLGAGRPSGRNRVPGAFRPTLHRGPLTFAEALRAHTPASQLSKQDPSQALPQIKLYVVTLTGVWDATVKSGDKEQRAVLVLEQNCDQLAGSYSGAQGSFNLSGEVKGDQVSWKFTGDLSAAFSAALRNGVLEGKFEMKGTHGTFHARKRGKEDPWAPRPDLLSSGPRDNHFVVEVDNSGLAHLRFGDGELGRAPEPGARATASYRIGGGPAGNLGAHTISRMVLHENISGLAITRVFNPMPAAGGVAPEGLDEARLLAPTAFRSRLERAITAADYATLAERNPKVQRAAAELRFTGNRYAVRVAIDPFGSELPGPELLEEIKRYLYRFRRIGHDLEVVPARYVPLDIQMTVCVRPAYLTEHVKAALLDTFGTSVLPEGGLGFFHPDNLTFGDSIFLSRLIGAAQAVAGVQAVGVTTLQRLYIGENAEIENGILPIGPLEIARLDSDPNFPENGRLKFTMEGGR
jgi:Baseplate J-like protein